MTLAEDPAPLDREARIALKAWASLTSDANLTPMARATNPLWRLDGSGPPLVLKQLPQYPPGVPPVMEFRVLTHLQQRGVPVALPLLTDDGTLCVTVEERQWILLPHLPGSRDLGPDPTTAYEVGGAIGRLDRALADCPWPVDSYVDDPVVIITEALPELPPEARQLVEPLLGMLEDTCAGLPAQLTHGDCNAGNVLIDQGHVTAILDVDHLPTGPRPRDLAYYLVSRLGPELVPLVGDFVRGFRQAHPVTDREIRAIIPLMLIIEIGGAHWALHGWQTDHDSYRRSLRSIDWIVNHLDLLTRSVQTADSSCV